MTLASVAPSVAWTTVAIARVASGRRHAEGAHARVEQHVHGSAASCRDGTEEELIPGDDIGASGECDVKL
jgi:hypothetical protein